MKRIFVVGCPRSGTTLVQSILGQHPGFVSFPESHVFSCSVSGLTWRQFGRHLGFRSVPRYVCGQILTSMGLALPKFHNRIFEFFEEAGLEAEKGRFNKLSKNRISPALSNFIDVLDAHAGSDGWIEKTPNNIFCLDIIQKYVPDALVIHVIRDGEATLASIVDAARRYESWNSRYLQHANNIERLVAMWNRSATISLSYANKPNHFLIRHEALTQNPEAEVRRMTDFLGILYSENFLAIDAVPYICPSETWKKNMGNSIKPQKSKFTEVFTEKEQNYIQQNLKPIAVPYCAKKRA